MIVEEGSEPQSLLRTMEGLCHIQRVVGGDVGVGARHDLGQEGVLAVGDEGRDLEGILGVLPQVAQVVLRLVLRHREPKHVKF